MVILLSGSAGLGRLPGWLLGPLLVVVIVAILDLLFPVGLRYLAERYVQKPYVNPELAVARWLVALAVLPWAFVQICCCQFGRDPRRILDFWVYGIALSGALATTDLLGLTATGDFLGNEGAISGRESGLATHANNLAVSCAVALPLSVALGRRRPFLAVLCGVAITGGALASGSRGGQLGAVSSLLFVFILVRGSRRRLWTGVAVFGVAAFAMAALVPSIGDRLNLDKVLRFANSSGTTASDSGRRFLVEQAIADFLHRPLSGIGYEVLNHAHDIYLQMLSSGGLLLAGSFAVLTAGAMRTGLSASRRGFALGGYLVASLLTWLQVGLVENQLTDRYLYFPLAALVVVEVVAHVHPREPVSRPELEASQEAEGQTSLAGKRPLPVGVHDDLEGTDPPGWWGLDDAPEKDGQPSVRPLRRH
ncbi:O-antigen ligase [Nocardioides ginsengisegetis]|uniref:O-antigen ligase n=1 Tax=Nocardioides ginsengisegetis TaxID=661491 RepID=A0A7W3IWL4_9ACTN|nr:O-antigen ligase family protein [Nocardioides ginsengisegetis]MBA8801834.1 O-antigen ligase [Nocardioides ginsengisegetis]